MANLSAEHAGYYRCKLDIKPVRHIGHASATHVVINALFKSIKLPHGALNGYLQFKLGKVLSMKARLKAGQLIQIELAFFQVSLSEITAWLDAMHAYLETAQSGFEGVACSEVEWVDVNKVLSAAASVLSEATSAELFFETPLPFERERSSSRTHLAKAEFFKQLQKRFQTLLGISWPMPDLTQFEMQHWYWHYDETVHSSKSQSGHKQFFNGCRGPLFFDGNLDEIKNWLYLANLICAGGSLELNFMGACQLHVPARNKFDAQLVSSDFWRSMHEELLDDNDQWAAKVYAELGSDHFSDAFYDDLVNEISLEHYQTRAATTFTVQKAVGSRVVELYAVKDHMVMYGLHHLLQPYANLIFEPSSHGFRPGYSVNTAAEAVEQYIHQGFEFVLETDIQDFFPNVRHDKLLDVLNQFLPPSDTKTRALLQTVIKTDYIQNNQLYERRQGLPVGSALSPLLANLYLDQFDEQVACHAQVKLVRYADDLLVMCQSAADATAVQIRISEYLGALGLSMRPDKTSIRHVAEGFQFLGRNFGGAGQAEIIGRPLKKTVYITEDNIWLGHSGDALQIKKPEGTLEIIPFRQISDIIVLARGGLGTGVLQKCARFLIPVTLTLGDGYHINTIMPDSRHFFAISQQQSMHYYKSSMQDRLAVAKQFSAHKILNYIPVIRSRYQKGNHVLIQSLQAYAEKIQQASTVESIRGLEGSAARLWFAEFNRRIKNPDFVFKQRRRDANDPMNGLFNFAYYLLFTRINALLRSEGLNPYLGYLHDGDDSYETLVCDVEELFRAHVDQMLLSTVNLGIISRKDFENKVRGKGETKLRLTRPAIRRFLIQFEKMLHTIHGHHTLLEIMQMQTRSLREYYTKHGLLWIYQNEVNKAYDQTGV